MTRKFWTTMLLTSFLASFGAAYYLFNQLAKKESAMMIYNDIKKTGDKVSPV